MNFNIGDYIEVPFMYNNGEVHLCDSSNCNKAGTKEFLVIGKEVNGLCNRPFILVEFPNTWSRLINEFCITKYGVNSRFHGKQGFLIPKHEFGKYWILKITKTASIKLDGSFCCNKYCRDFIQYAPPNLPNGKFICRSCRTNIATCVVVLAEFGYSLIDLKVIK